MSQPNHDASQAPPPPPPPPAPKPSPSSDAASARPAPPGPHQDPVLDAFHGRIPPVPLPLHYRIDLGIAACAMVLLPLVYIALVGLAGYGLVSYLAWYFEIGESATASNKSFWHVLWLSAAGIAWFFMFKPLLASPPAANEGRKLLPLAEKRMYDFVKKVCDAVGAPYPVEIHVNCEVNASAGFGQGLVGLFSNHLILTIGLPLASGLTLAQFAGVLGHEMGHFAQGAGMRLTYTIRAVNLWFYRVVFERDAWDEFLDKMSELFFLWPIVWPAKAMIFVTRGILYGLMFVGHVMSCFLERQMEYDADRYGALLVGREIYQSIAPRVRKLSIASFGAHSDLEQFWNEGRLADDLPALVVANVNQIPKETIAAYDKMQRFQSTGIFDTHPSDQDRAARLARLDAPGIFLPAPPPPPKSAAPAKTRKPPASPTGKPDPFGFDAFGRDAGAGPKPGAAGSKSNFGNPFSAAAKSGASISRVALPAVGDAPAPRFSPETSAWTAELFSSYKTLARASSLDFYKAVLGDKVKGSDLHGIDDLLKRQEKELEGNVALWRFFQSKLVDSRPLRLAEHALAPPADPAAEQAQLRQTRQAMLKAVPFYAFARKKYLETEEKLNQLRQARVLFDLGVPIDATDILGDTDGPSDIADAEKKLRAAQAERLQKLEDFEAPARARLVAGLNLLLAPSMEGRIPELEETRADIRKFWSVLALVEGLLPELAELLDCFSELTVLIPFHEQHPEYQPLIQKIRAQGDKLHDQLDRVRARLGEEPYPFDHADKKMTLARYALPQMPPKIDINGTLQCTEQLYGQLQPLYYRLLARFTLAAEKVERAVGLPDLKMPAEVKDLLPQNQN